MRLTTTLNRIRACSPCTRGWKTLIKHVGQSFDPDKEINLLTILESNGVADMMWCLRATIQDSKQTASILAIEFAENVLPIFENRMPNDKRPRAAIQAARDYGRGLISIDTLRAARRDASDAAAYAAAYDAAAYAALAAAYDAAYAASADASDAAADASDAASDAAADASDAASDAASYAALADAYGAAYAATNSTPRKRQAEIIRMYLDL